GFANTASRTNSGFTAVEYLPRLTHWLWNINLVSAVPHLGARSICLCSRAGRDVARRSFEKIWTLRPPSPGPAVTPGGRAAMVRNTGGAPPCQHYLHRPGHDRPTPPRLDARLLQRHAHGLYFSRHRQRQHPRHHRRCYFDVCPRTFHRPPFRYHRRNPQTRPLTRLRRDGRTG